MIGGREGGREVERGNDDGWLSFFLGACAS